MHYPTPNSLFLRTLLERGFVHQCTDWHNLDAWLTEGERTHTPRTAYIGFDCTAASLHVGSLIQIMILHHFQQAGHKPVVLMGSGTTRVGDPSGKDKTRAILNDATIEANKKGIHHVFTHYLTFGDKAHDAVMVDNADWLLSLNYIAFLRDVGRHFSINRMLTMDSVRQRVEREQELSFLEFNYMILQAYDFAELYQRHGCRLQMGGSDQWGNITQGVDLHRRLIAADGAPINEAINLFGLTTPLLTTASGAKMGKTADGAIWLNAELLSPYDYWQFWRNVDDADVGRFLRLFTTLPLADIHALEQSEGAAINEAKKRLATEVTALLHGRDAAQTAEATARALFEQGTTDAHTPTVALSLASLEQAHILPYFTLLHRAGLAASSSEARRLIKGGGVRINDIVITQETATIDLITQIDHAPLKISVGKKKHVLVQITP
ncbi:MAG: tyrosine--tRNA ligase [Alphaproteobacteria bacterium]|nr:MAG: tyrosine--tRNA ligase [Alphaproteobacteria bacterium]